MNINDLLTAIFYIAVIGLVVTAIVALWVWIREGRQARQRQPRDEGRSAYYPGHNHEHRVGHGHGFLTGALVALAILLFAGLIVGIVGVQFSLPWDYIPTTQRTFAYKFHFQNPVSSTSQPLTPGTTVSPSKSETVVLVLNGGHVNGAAARLSDQLKQAGYTVQAQGNTKPSQDTFVYYKDKQYKPVADSFAQKLNAATGKVVWVGQSNSIPPGVNILIVLGENYKDPPS